MKIHILAISGAMTAPLAVALKKQGNVVTGSDQNKIYPPFSTMLSRAKIVINPPQYTPDLYIIGSSFSNQQSLINEFEEIKKSKVPFISATNYIAQNLIKQNSILVAGSYGKSSITAMLSFLLRDTKLHPTYMFGGQCKNSIPSLFLTHSNWSICEADESINGLDTQAKFLYYPVKYLILTSANWEHKESYSTTEDNFEAFKKLIEKLPDDGLLVYNNQDESLRSLLKFAKCKAIPYTSEKVNHKYLFGRAFENNFAAVKTLCDQLKISTTKISQFRGLKHRLELVATRGNIIFYSDFAQSSIRIKTTLDSISDQYPDRRILVILEPHASFLQYKKSVLQLSDSLNQATMIFLSKISYSKNLNKHDRISFNDYKSIFDDKINYLPMTSDLINSVTSSIQPQDIVVRFSSGGKDGQKAFNKIINFFK